MIGRGRGTARIYTVSVHCQIFVNKQLQHFVLRLYKKHKSIRALPYSVERFRGWIGG